MPKLDPRVNLYLYRIPNALSCAYEYREHLLQMKIIVAATVKYNIKTLYTKTTNNKCLRYFCNKFFDLPYLFRHICALLLS